MSAPTDVEVRQFARVYVDSPGQLPPQAENRKNERGYFYKLDLDGLDEQKASALVQKASETFDVVVVGQVVENGTVTKERRYVDSVTDVPEGYAPERGPKGGVFYETQPVEGSPDVTEQDMVGDPSEEVGYSGEPVLAVQFEDIDVGDRIAFEQQDGERDMGEVVSINEDDHVVTVESGDGTTDVASAPLDVGEEKAEGSVTSDTGGAHNAVYGGAELPETCRLCDNQRQEGSILCSECDDAKVDKKEDVWTYYYGPNGGEGWINMNTGEIRYQKERPGAAPAEGDGYGDYLDDGWAEPPDEFTDLTVGQEVEFTVDDEYREGTVVSVDEDSATVRGEESGDKFSVGEQDGVVGNLTDEAEAITAVEDNFNLHEELIEERGADDLNTLDPEEAEEWVQELGIEPGDKLKVAKDGEEYETVVHAFNDAGKPVVDGEFASKVFDIPDMAEVDQIAITEDNVPAADDLDIDPYPDDWVDPQMHNLDTDLSPWEYLEEGDEVAYQPASGDEWIESEVVYSGEAEVLTENDDMLWSGTEIRTPKDVAEPSDEEPEEDEPMVDEEGLNNDGILSGAYHPGDHPEFDSSEYVDNEAGYDHEQLEGARVVVEDPIEDTYAFAEIDENGNYYLPDTDEEFLESDLETQAVHEDDYAEIDEPTDPFEDDEPTDLLDETGAELGDTFEFEGQEVEVVGTESMMSDGEPSHITVENDEGVEVPVHPNMVPDDLGEGDEDVAEGSAMGTPEDEQDPAADAVGQEVEEGSAEGSDEGPSVEFEPAEPEDFASSVSTFAEENPEMGAYLTEHDPEELQDHEIFLAEDGQVGASVSPEGDIQNVFNGTDIDGAAEDAVEKAIEAGGKTLDCYEGFLSGPEGYYQQFGFVETARQEFEPKFAPDELEYDPENPPDVVFMHYDPEQAYETADTYIDDWDEAKQLSRERATDPGAAGGTEGVDDAGGASGAEADGADEGVGVGSGEQDAHPESGSADGQAVDASGLWENHDDMKSWTPDAIEETHGMGKVNASTGNTVDAKQVVTMPDGTEAVYTDTHHHKGDPELGERAVASSNFIRELTDDYDQHGVPQIEGDPQSGYFFTAAAPGEDVIKAPDEYVENLDEEDFYRQAAMQVMAGNNDAHVRNVKIDEDGNLHWFDMDHAGGDFDAGALNKSHLYDDGWDRIFGELARTGGPEGLGLGSNDEVRTRVFEKALDLADEFDDDAIEQAKQAASEENPEFAETMAENIRRLQTGDVPYEP